MATYTDNYNLVKPTMAETADIRTINGNMDSVDNIMHATQVSLAPAYDSSETYNTGDIVMYEFLMYECLDDDVTGTWDATKWQRTTAGEHGGGGGGSNVEITPTLQSGTKIADFEIDGVSGALYAPSGGGGGSSQFIADVIWSGSETPSTAGTDITLSHAISDYDFIVFTVTQGNGYDSTLIFATSELAVGGSYISTGYITDLCAFFTYTSDTAIKIKSSASANKSTYTKIVGLKICGTLAPMIYSTEEREVGVWVDNKPLYQKSYINVAGTGASVNVTLSDLSDIETIFIVPQGSNSTDDIPFPYVHYSSANLIGGFFTISNGVPTLAIRRGSDMAGVGLKFLTVCYTKTTDVAGSGSYGSLGIPMEHYDNTEKVVGTWLGDTLYEKTFNVTGLSCTTSDYFGSYSGSLDLSGYIGSYDEVFVDLDMSYLTTSGGVKERFVLVQALPNSTSINLFTCASRSNVSAVLTVRYTKSTT